MAGVCVRQGWTGLQRQSVSGEEEGGRRGGEEGGREGGEEKHTTMLVCISSCRIRHSMLMISARLHWIGTVPCHPLWKGESLSYVHKLSVPVLTSSLFPP